MFDDSFKKIKYDDDEVIITHFIQDEYDSHDYNNSYTFDKYRVEILKSYDIANELNLCLIINIARNRNYKGLVYFAVNNHMYLI